MSMKGKGGCSTIDSDFAGLATLLNIIIDVHDRVDIGVLGRGRGRNGNSLNAEDDGKKSSGVGELHVERLLENE